MAENVVVKMEESDYEEKKTQDSSVNERHGKIDEEAPLKVKKQRKKVKKTSYFDSPPSGLTPNFSENFE